MRCTRDVLKIDSDTNTYVTIEGFVLYAGGDYALHLNIMLLVQVMAYMMSGTFAADIVRTRIRPSDWCARSHDIAAGWKISLAWKVSLAGGLVNL